MTIPIKAPDSPLSTISHLSGSPPTLDSATLALLDSFYLERDEAERNFQLIAERAAAKLVERRQVEEEEAETANRIEDLPMLSVDEFRATFGEDWQLSQFWYSSRFAMKLAKFVRDLCSEESRVAFVCSPTAFVAFQHTNPLKHTKLLEFDRRFSILAGRSFVPYDIDEPENVPETLIGKVDLAVVDPPFLNEVTNRKVAQTLSLILHPTRGRLLLLTSTSVQCLPIVYNDRPIGPLFNTGLKIEHAGGIANDFGCWASWELGKTYAGPSHENE